MRLIIFTIAILVSVNSFSQNLVTIDASRARDTISRHIYGHFAEHLGELIYPGICVPPDCSIPNVNGIRTDVVEALRPLGIPVLRTLAFAVGFVCQVTLALAVFGWA